ncbi:flagellin [Selenomonas sp. ND2010]|uniref:flagellin n=1 Tax=Selenomonas sp. ND2010 TaxID=1410618 RepID=UPI00350ECD5C
MTNQSLHKDTLGGTRIVDLQNRNGESLNIQTTDTLTISYVIQGETYSFDVDINETTTLDSALVEASDPYVRNNPLMRAAYAQYDASRASANSTYNSSYGVASSTYGSAVSNATATYNGVVQNTLSTMNSASTNAVLNESLYNSAYISAFNAGMTPAQIAQNATVNGYLTNWTSSLSVYSTAASNYTSTQASAATVRDSSIASAATVRDSAYTAARSTLTVALSTAASTLADSVGELIPYKLSVDTGNVVGISASGDTVYTANRENAITISSGSAGLQYQLSGITFSVKDSKGQVKKSVNSVLDNFTESVRAFNKSNNNAINLQVGTKANQTIRIGLTDMRSEALGLKSSTGITLGVGTQKQANAAVNVLDNAIQKALDQQTDIGSIEARLEMTSSNLVISSENVQASESTMRDANMAKEMTEYTKNNILMQAAQAMLAQANQSSSNVLSLLQ